MTGNEYQELAMRTNDGKSTNRLRNFIDFNTDAFDEDAGVSAGDILNACLGLSGEVGELNDMVKKWIFHEKKFDFEHAQKEVGDIMWYIGEVCHAFGWDLDEVMQINIDKLKARYPEGFDTERANNRAADDV